MDGMQAMMAHRCIQPHLQLMLSPVPLTILHLVKCSFFTSSPLGDVGAWQLKRHVQCSAVAMLDQTVVTNIPGQ